jgi:hypothetical protein
MYICRPRKREKILDLLQETKTLSPIACTYVKKFWKLTVTFAGKPMLPHQTVIFCDGKFGSRC